MAFIHSGNYENSNPNNRASRGYFWSSTANTNINAYYLVFNSQDRLNPQYGDYYKYAGNSLRCLFSRF